MKLHIDPADGERFERLFDRDSMVIGRSSSSDLSLPDPFLSRFHARMFRDGDDILVEDLGSRNGTFLNGVAVAEPTRVTLGDEIKVSGSTIAIRDPLSTFSEVTEIGSDLNATIFRPASELLEEGSSTHPAELEGEAELRRYAERLKLFNEIHEALASSLSLEALLELILDRAFHHLGPEHGVIFLREKDGDYARSAQRSAGQQEDLPLSRSLIHEVCSKGLAAMVLDTATDARFAEAESIIMAGVRSLIAAPMLDGDDALGMIVLSSRAGGRQFSDADLEFLVSMASVAAMRVRNAALAEEAAERQRLEDQLALARRIQESILPDQLPEIPSLSLYAQNLPSLGVSGDYYQVMQRENDTECVLLLADVSGKGVPASLLTTSLEALTAAPIDEGRAPDEIFSRVSRQLWRRTPPEKYATAFLATYNIESGVLTYTNAGHNPSLLVREGGEVEQLAAGGMPIGLLEVSSYEKQDVQLMPGDTLVIYTDGITEAENPEEEEYGEERLSAIARGNRNKSLPEMAAAIQENLDEFASGIPYHDDRTLLLARREHED